MDASPRRDPAPDAPALRATDSDRERAAAVLQVAAADGRLSTGELEERLELVYGARFTGELTRIVRDLQPLRRESAGKPSPDDLVVISGFVRRGRWVVGDEYRGTAVMGSGVIDLHEAELTGPETTIRVSSWISTVYVVVPDGVEVSVSGRGILGGFTQDRESAGHPAAHRVIITGVAVCGTVRIVHQLPASLARRLHRHERRRIGNRSVRNELDR